jgi:hypothetical protein
LKKAISIVLLSLALAAIGASNLAANESPYFVKTVPISTVYNHQLGYRIVYMTNNYQFKTFYIPQSWFAVAGQSGEIPKAELVMGNEAAYPYFSVFYLNGEFSHIRLYLRRNLNDMSWGDASRLGNISANFDVETLNLEF